MSNDARDGFESEREHLSPLMTIGGTVVTATAFETTIDTFCNGHSDRVSKPMRELVREAGDAVTRHRRWFVALPHRSDVAECIRDRIVRPVVDHKFRYFNQLLILRDNPDYQLPLQCALSRETAAAEAYAALALTARVGSIGDRLRFLGKGKLKHEAEFQKRGHKLAHRDGA